MPNTRVAGNLTTDDWNARRAALADADANEWAAAFTDFFIGRLRPRYLDPIETLQANGKLEGEGFSIVALQCSLIEFLESSFRGTNYKRPRKDDPLGQHEYYLSEDLFVSFLSSRHPFSQAFDDASAKDFYESVRCAVLHEARTKNGWTIRAGCSSCQIADTQSRVVYRDNFQSALLDYIKQYGVLLQSDKALQDAFVRKFDGLCA